MSAHRQFSNRVRELRVAHGWSQEDLARRSGLSRAGVSSIEIGALCPSTAAALALAACVQCPVEEIFFLGCRGSPQRQWAWSPPGAACRYWMAEVNGRRLHFPVEPSLPATTHDGVYREGEFTDRHADRIPRGKTDDRAADKTLVIACCDPGVGVLAEPLRQRGVRLLALTRSSRAALELLKNGLVHAAGVHLARSGTGDRGNVKIVRQAMTNSSASPDCACRLLHVARWEEGVALARASGISSAAAAAKANLRWVGREQGSGARQRLDELLVENKTAFPSETTPAHRDKPRGESHGKRCGILARDHRGVAEAVRAGWADAGICLRLAAEECGVDFLPLCREQYDLCFFDAAADDPCVRALIEAAQSRGYRQTLADLPGYDASATGEVVSARR